MKAHAKHIIYAHSSPKWSMELRKGSKDNGEIVYWVSLLDEPYGATLLTLHLNPEDAWKFREIANLLETELHEKMKVEVNEFTETNKELLEKRLAP